MIPSCAACLILAPSAVAAPDPCSASGVAATASGVLNSASGYLDGHPDVNNVLTSAVNQSPAEAKSSVRGYFLSHVGEALELKGIAQPLLDLKGRCNSSVSPDQLAALFDALSAN
ncbi:heme-binding protein [Candidatus Mycobacterium wuenschmannii]|uniref:Heme-binding protein n=1 Tax=Candidatus Mycobacterium wuenschmannii TaxID=3027808 RepID=A0ABY8VYJ7_9MYCO|nr:heme-binding protein [Candidatus Mycobacterium wuenschmannii]WIM87262.1 heme-binding protein [Candidatus Mycobacterium wuenschmannii]